MVKKSDKKLIDSFFGTNNKTRFRRLIILILVLAAVIMVTLNLRYENGQFGWGPAVDVNINVGEESPGGTQ